MTDVQLRYEGVSGVATDGDGARVDLLGALDRADVSLTCRLRDPVRFREAMAAMYAVVRSDLRYKPKDRTAHLAYQRMRKRSAGLSAVRAQREYFDWLARNDPDAWVVLDPVLSVHEDGITLEVFSKDEGTYAQLSVGKDALEIEGTPRPGTTNIDFSAELFEGLERLRSYRNTSLNIGRAAVALATDGDDPGEVVEKRVKVPDSWLRGFLQVQSAAGLIRAQARPVPIDLYNVLRTLRLNKDRKRGGRAIRFELVPGEVPRLVLEPWETVIACGGEPYTGRRAEIVRIWGRRRLMLLRRWLPFVDSVQVELLGSGMPSFWVLRSGAFTLTLGLTGFTSADWGRALALDVLLPRPGADAKHDGVLEALARAPVADAAALAERLNIPLERARAGLQAAAAAGLAVPDFGAGVVRLRPILDAPVPTDRLQNRTERERVARDLLATSGAVKVTKENRIHGSGLEVIGKVAVAAEQREYRAELLLDDEGRVRKATCTGAFFRKHGLKEGPCEHLIALRLAHAERERKRALRREKGTAAIQVETRSYGRRHAAGEAVVQISLERKRLKVRWGERSDARMRVQNLVFDSVEEARNEYYRRAAGLESDGWLDASAS